MKLPFSLNLSKENENVLFIKSLGLTTKEMDDIYKYVTSTKTLYWVDNVNIKPSLGSHCSKDAIFRENSWKKIHILRLRELLYVYQQFILNPETQKNELIIDSDNIRSEILNYKRLDEITPLPVILIEGMKITDINVTPKQNHFQSYKVTVNFKLKMDDVKLKGYKRSTYTDGNYKDKEIVVLDKNNNCVELKSEELAEIKRYLMTQTPTIRREVKNQVQNYESNVELDCNNEEHDL